MILKKLVVICLTRTGHCPKVKKKKHHKDSLSCICISWHPSSKKQTWETYLMPMHAVWNQSFCCQSKKITRSKHSCEESKGTCSSSRLWGVREKIRGKVILALQLSPLGYAWRNKKTKERKRTNESIWSKHKTQYIYISFIWLFVLEWYPLEVKENLDHAQEQVSCKCLHQYSRIVAL